MQAEVAEIENVGKRGNAVGHITLSDWSAVSDRVEVTERRERLASLLAEAGLAVTAGGDPSATIQTWGYDSGSADARVAISIRRLGRE